MQNTKYISIISGKGGTGKSLLTAVFGRMLAREGKKVLLVDFDIFVRGLTILLSKYYSQIHKPELLTSTSFFYSELSPNYLSNNLLIGRFLECDFLPATYDIGEKINYELVNQSLRNDFKNRFKLFKQLIAKNKQYEYDYVIFDCRSGIDTGIIDIARASDCIISVAEDDDVCIQTNSNLINLLRYDCSVRNIFTIVNKGRRLLSMEDVNSSSLNRLDFNFVGVIPFDIEVMEDFGKERFWNTLNETFYYRAVIESWNRFARRNKLDEVSEKQYHNPPVLLQKRFGLKQNLIERMMLLYSILSFIAAIVLLGINVFSLSSNSVNYGKYSLILLLFSILSFIFSRINIKRLLLDDFDKPFLKSQK
jgi:septum site-determining protein MinD